MVHADNAPAHNSKMTRSLSEQNPLKSLPRPPHSPDISPSAFYLSGKVNEAPIGQNIPEEICFLNAVIELLNGISTGEFQRVFHSWIEHVEGVITAEVGEWCQGNGLQKTDPGHNANLLGHSAGHSIVARTHGLKGSSGTSEGQ
jgi:hypothetical protein